MRKCLKNDGKQYVTSFKGPLILLKIICTVVYIKFDNK
jgi:hypothetical protein